MLPIGRPSGGKLAHKQTGGGQQRLEDKHIFVILGCTQKEEVYLFSGRYVLHDISQDSGFCREVCKKRLTKCAEHTVIALKSFGHCYISN